jgi:PEP-CTERM motif-containing protein
MCFSSAIRSGASRCLSDATLSDPPENPADSLGSPNTPDCTAVGQACVAEISVNGVERIDYTPGPGQPGYNANPSDGDVFHYVIYSDTPEPSGLLLFGSGLIGIARTLKRKVF